MSTAKQLLLKIAGVATFAGAAVPAFADGFDLASVLTILGGIAAAVASVGIIVLGIYATIVGWKLLRKAF